VRKLEALFERMVEVTGLDDAYRTHYCARAGGAGSPYCRRYCRDESGQRGKDEG
jgi:hypothetical protein